MLPDAIALKHKNDMQSILLSFLKPLATLASGAGAQKKLFILIYHRVLDEPDFMMPGEVDKQAFTWQMALLSRYFNVLPLGDALERLQSGTLPSRAVSITFDDGYADNYTHALPILKQFGFSATFFIASGYLNGGRMWNDSVIEAIRAMPQPQLDLTAIQLGSHDIATPTQKATSAQRIIQKIKHLEPEQRLEYTRYIEQQAADLPDNLMLSTEQLVKLQQSGMEIGGHTVTHPILAKLDKNEATRELIENKMVLENILDTKLRYFAYPNGKPGQDYLPEQVALIKESGYQAAVSTQWGVATALSDTFQLPRFLPWDRDPVKFMARMIHIYIGMGNGGNC